jgi:YcxB-like protein
MPVPEPVSVTTTLTAADYSSAIRTMLFDRYGWFKRAAFVFSVGFLFYIACALYLKSDHAGRLFPATVILLLLILPFWVALTPYFSARSFIRKNPHVLGPTDCTFSSDGAVFVGPNGRGENRWTAYQRIQETTRVFLFYAQSNYAGIIPKRCFRNEADILRLREILRTSFQGKFESR